MYLGVIAWTILVIAFIVFSPLSHPSTQHIPDSLYEIGCLILIVGSCTGIIGFILVLVALFKKDFSKFTFIGILTNGLIVSLIVFLFLLAIYGGV